MNFLNSNLNSKEKFMAKAVDLALKGRPRTAPNPCVGAVLVVDNKIVASGYHEYCGGLHAERNCIANAKKKNIDMAKATIYVTLEPCNHYGKTPPCTEAILEAGIKKVVVGTRDPNPKAAGGIEFLLSHGIEIEAGVYEERCKDIISDFLHWQKSNRPYSILKLASTIDGKIAGSTGLQEPVSSPQSFADVQRYRSMVQAVIVGGNTLREDNPSLNCRAKDLPENFIQPKAVIVTTKLPENHEDYTLTTTRAADTIFFTSHNQKDSDLAAILEKKGITILSLPENENGLILEEGFKFLRKNFNIYRTLCEGGGCLANSLVEQSLIDEFVMYQAPIIFGNKDGRPNFSGSKNSLISQCKKFTICSVEQSGCDLKTVFKPQES